MVVLGVLLQAMIVFRLDRIGASVRHLRADSSRGLIRPKRQTNDLFEPHLAQVHNDHDVDWGAVMVGIRAIVLGVAQVHEHLERCMLGAWNSK